MSRLSIGLPIRNDLGRFGKTPLVICYFEPTIQFLAENVQHVAVFRFCGGDQIVDFMRILLGVVQLFIGKPGRGERGLCRRQLA